MCTSAEALVKTEATSFVCAPWSLMENHPATTLARPTLPRPPHPVPTFVTMANAPLLGQDGRDKEVIWVRWKQEYFCKGDWTGQISLKPLQKIAQMRRAISPPFRRIDGRAGQESVATDRYGLGLSGANARQTGDELASSIHRRDQGGDLDGREVAEGVRDRIREDDLVAMAHRAAGIDHVRHVSFALGRVGTQ
jgi:hypothetical protein